MPARRGPGMPDPAPCPHCGRSEWLPSDGLYYLPRTRPNERGEHEADLRNGINVRVWRCDNCLYVMTFWEPDFDREE